MIEGIGVGTIVSIALFIVLMTLMAKGVRTVSQGEEWIIERFGRYLRTLPPGLSVIIPLFDRVRLQGDNQRHRARYRKAGGHHFRQRGDSNQRGGVYQGVGSGGVGLRRRRFFWSPCAIWCKPRCARLSAR